jgi:hypothetical protein
MRSEGHAIEGPSGPPGPDGRSSLEVGDLAEIDVGRERLWVEVRRVLQEGSVEPLYLCKLRSVPLASKIRMTDTLKIFPRNVIKFEKTHRFAAPGRGVPGAPAGRAGG